MHDQHDSAADNHDDHRHNNYNDQYNHDYNNHDNNHDGRTAMRDVRLFVRFWGMDGFGESLHKWLCLSIACPRMHKRGYDYSGLPLRMIHETHGGNGGVR